MLNLNAVDALYSATYIEDYLDSVENLPDDIQRLITRYRELDMSAGSFWSDAQAFMKRYIKIIREPSSGNSSLEAGRLSSLITSKLISCQEYGDQKIYVAQRIQEYLENKVRQLDLDRKNLDSACRTETQETPVQPRSEQSERSLKRVRRIRQEVFIPSVLGPSTLVATSYNSEGRGESLANMHEVSNSTPRNNATSSSSRTPATTPSASSINRNSHGGERRGDSSKESRTTTKSSEHSSTPTSTIISPRKSEKRGSSTHLSSSAPPPPSDIYSDRKRSRRRRLSNKQFEKKPISIPLVDPDEPTYCLCNQVSYGEMIGCDNDLCPIEWFHFSCVSLSNKPKGKWFCPKCRGERPNVMKPKAIFLKELEKYNREKEERS